ncbi:15-hydroxyprostaglandin dehydrogenase [NAD(+)]-like [Centroberyx affinis]|uniref:15-hydroxyprostaglandin dehydrogenase [NAD(+)]-like n=1 Tax=Centroberyx affinis TaxID=166261 RepID=UPI003A5C5657
MALVGKIAVVTGAAEGLGRGISEILLQNGAKVALLDMNETEGKRSKEAFDKQYGPDKTLFLNCNVESEQQFKAAFEKTVQTFGRPDIMCNNAGILNEADWDKAVSVNLMGVVRGSYLALEHMSKLTGGQGGVIINMASIAGLEPVMCTPVYTATKHGVVGFTRAMAAASDVSGYGVRFNVLCPAFVKTKISMHARETSGQFAHLVKEASIYFQKFGMLEVSEVAERFLQLATDETKNGEALVIQSKGSDYVAFPTL